MFIRLEVLSRVENGQIPFSFTGPSPDPDAPGELTLKGTAQAEKDLVRVSGKLHLSYIAQCARCLCDVPSVMDLDFDEDFVRGKNEDDEDECYHYNGQTLDLTQMAAEAIALNLPLRHLCHSNCKGLCPRCGADLNLGDCGCETADRSSSSIFSTDLHEEV